jgi:transcriptional regulator with XRE-family HTH domain
MADMATREELINSKIGKTIARQRKAAGFTQQEVVDQPGVGAEAFSRIERGIISADIFKLYEMADMFKCGVETFLIEGSRPTDQVE